MLVFVLVESKASSDLPSRIHEHEHEHEYGWLMSWGWDVLLGYFTGLRFLTSDIDPVTLVRTAVFIHVLDSVMCRLFAHNNGYPKNLWTLLGFVFGIWAVAVLIVLPRRPPPA